MDKKKSFPINYNIIFKSQIHYVHYNYYYDYYQGRGRYYFVYMKKYSSSIDEIREIKFTYLLKNEAKNLKFMLNITIKEIPTIHDFSTLKENTN